MERRDEEHRYVFKGPSKWVKSTFTVRPLKQKDILHASIQTNRRVIDLVENRLFLHGYYVYHSYRWLDEEGQIRHNRWYNRHLNPDDFTIQGNMLAWRLPFGLLTIVMSERMTRIFERFKE